MKPKNAAIKFAAHLVEVAAASVVRPLRTRTRDAARPEKVLARNAILLAVQAFPQVLDQITDDDVKDCELDRTQQVTEFVDCDTVVESELAMKQFAIRRLPRRIR